MKKALFCCISLLVVLLLCVQLCGCTPKIPEHDHDWQLKPVAFDGTVGISACYKCSVCNEEKTATVKNIILFIADGMGPQQLMAGQLASKSTFGFTQWQHSMVNTTNVLGEITDSAAAATAMATGTLTVNHAVGQDVDGNRLSTILDFAKQRGMRTGIVTTDVLTGATPASFSAHVPDRDCAAADIITSQLASDVDLLCAAYNTTVGLRTDLIDDSPYAYCNKFENREEIMDEEQALCLFKIGSAGTQVALADAATFAMDYLENDNGYVLMIEQAHIDKYSHDQSTRYVAEAVIDMNNTVEAVQKHIGDSLDTALMLTADHETCGLQVSEEAIYPNSYEFANGAKLYFDWTADYHTDVDVDFFYQGFYADLSKMPVYGSADRIKNTDIFLLMKALVEQIRG